MRASVLTLELEPGGLISRKKNLTSWAMLYDLAVYLISESLFQNNKSFAS